MTAFIFKFRNLLHFIASDFSPEEKKRISLLNKATSFIILLNIPYLYFYYTSGFHHPLVVSSIIVFCYLLILFINYIKMHYVAKILILLNGNLNIFFSLVLLGEKSGKFLFFFPAILAPFLLFHPSLKRTIFVTIFIPVFFLVVSRIISHLYQIQYSLSSSQYELLFEGCLWGAQGLTILFIFYYYRENVKTEKELYEASVTDLLTGIYNYSYLIDCLQRDFKRAQRNNFVLSVILFDADNFKQINDDFGHLKGDEVLQLIADSVQGIMREEDIFGRYGGEEFMVIVPGLGRKEAGFLAQRICDQIRETSEFSGVLQRAVTVSLGVADTAEKEILSVQDLIGKADKALYQAKKNGKNCVVVSN